MRKRSELIIQVSNMLDDNLHLMRVIKLQLDQRREAYAIFEEITAQLENMAVRVLGHCGRGNPRESEDVVKYDNVTVKQTEAGFDTLLPKEVCDELGITKAIEKGPIVLGHGKPTVTLRPQWGEGTQRAGFNEPSSR